MPGSDVDDNPDKPTIEQESRPSVLFMKEPDQAQVGCFKLMDGHQIKWITKILEHQKYNFLLNGDKFDKINKLLQGHQ